ncbi:hypothetical protein [Acetobacterium tundrae]|uniref:hypothetical protein n=1 Tax=Acetobacterium tundrae TaxID=132932 RepID=UPI00164AB31B|nr:hypothetical protein [Acetobacterium tundrae]
MAENSVVQAGQRQVAPINSKLDIFSGLEQFELGQRMAKALASSTIVPKHYQQNTGNCLIALEMSSRLGVGPLMVMQNLYIVNGMPSWSSQYIIAMINSSKKYKTELQYHFEGEGADLSCYAYAEDYNEHQVIGPTISIDMAKKEGWYGKNGSKWPNMPEVMIRYRAASFFGRINCPDMIMGIYSTEELLDGVVEYQVLDPEEAVKQEIESNANTQTLDFDGAEDNKKPIQEENKEVKETVTPEEIKAIEEAEIAEVEDDLPDFMK